MKRAFSWFAANLLAAAFVLSNRSDVLLVKGSDSLVTTYRVAGFYQGVALILFGLGAGIVLFPAPNRVFSGGAWIRAAAGFVGTACLLAAGHGVTVAAKDDRVELTEYLGPAPLRVISPSGPEDRLSSRCGRFFLTIAPSASSEGKVFLGWGPWRLPGALCRHPLLQPTASTP